MKSNTLTLLAFLSLFFSAHSQLEFDYTVELEPVSVSGLVGLHSYAFAQHEGKWLIIGGRRDGIHARQPFNAFPENQNNKELFVVDPQTGELWTGQLNTLPTGIFEQLQSTNMNFYQDADTLYIIGGYSFSVTADDHITHPKLTSIVVSATIDAIINGSSFATNFKQISDDTFANTGAQMGKIGDFFYLIGGHRFDGRYNPMNNPTFTQTYHTKIQKFKLNNSGSQLSFSDYSADTDPVNLRRRDYNLLPQIYPDGAEGYMISSGVFQQDTDLPFLYPVDITHDGYTPVPTFNQYLSHYHGAKVATYDTELNETHNLFFGGMSQYYYENGELIQDDLVPFVKTISRVSRGADGTLQEFLMPIEMPGLQGAGSEFIPNMEVPYTSKKVLLLNNLTEDTTIIGYIFGGIQTASLNPFSNNQTNTTSADPTIYAVKLIKSEELGVIEIDGSNPFSISVFPNPASTEITVTVDMTNATNARYLIHSIDGKLVQKGRFKQLKPGVNSETIELDTSIEPQMLNLTVVIDGKFFLNEKIIKE